MPQQVLTVKEVAKILRISRNTAYQALRKGDIPSVRIGKRWVIPVSGIQRLLESDI